MLREQLQLVRDENPFATLHDVISDILLKQIIHFRLRPGERLVESRLAEQFGVSRSPVRLALCLLDEKGFIYKDNGAYFVKPLSLKEYNDLNDLSTLLEPYAAGLAAERISAAQLSRLYEMAHELKALYRRLIEQSSPGGIVAIRDLEYGFHSYLVDIAGNEAVSKIYGEYINHIFHYRSFILQDPPFEFLDALSDDHIFICDTLKIHDSNIASAVAKRHLTLSRNIIEKNKGLMFLK